MIDQTYIIKHNDTCKFIGSRFACLHYVDGRNIRGVAYAMKYDGWKMVEQDNGYEL